MMQNFRIFSLVPPFSNILKIHLKRKFTGLRVLQMVLECQGQDQICPLICQICHTAKIKVKVIDMCIPTREGLNVHDFVTCLFFCSEICLKEFFKLYISGLAGG